MADRGAWTPGTVYAVGDTVTYANDAFFCSVAHTAAAAFDGKYWSDLTPGQIGVQVANPSTQPVPAAITPSTVTLLAQLNVDVSVNGWTTADVDVSAKSELAITVNLFALAGVGASVTVHVDRKDANGGYVSLANTGALTATATVALSIGPGMATAHSIGSAVRLRWVTGGSITNARANLSVQGK